VRATLALAELLNRALGSVIEELIDYGKA